MPAAGLKDLLLFFVGRRKMFEVEGDSMLPALQPKQRIVAKPIRQVGPSPSPGSVVVFHHPADDNLVVIKRVWRANGHMLDLRGDNSEASTDSRHFGEVPLERLIGEVTAVIPLIGPAPTRNSIN